MIAVALYLNRMSFEPMSILIYTEQKMCLVMPFVYSDVHTAKHFHILKQSVKCIR